MVTFVLVIHFALCFALVGIVLLQQGKGADAGAIMGGGTDSLMGAGSAGSAVGRLTTGLAIGFMLTSITLVKLYEHGAFADTGKIGSALDGSLMEPELAVPATETAPAADSAVQVPAVGAPAAVVPPVEEKAAEAVNVPAAEEKKAE